MDQRPLILQLFKQYPAQILSLVSQLYRENGPEEIIFQGHVFRRRDKLMDDAVFDRLARETKFKEMPQNNANRLRVKQILQFGTLEKFTRPTLTKYLKRVKALDSQYVIMPKYDGIGMRVYYDAHGDFTALTRYDKNYGLDISFKIYPGMIPALKSCAVRGEIMTLKDHEDYKDRRSYASSQVSGMGPFDRDIVFIPYEYQEYLDDGTYIAPDYLTQLKVLSTFFKHKYEVHSLQEINPDMLEKFYASIPSEFQADGVVIRPVDANFTYEDDRERPRFTAAYKLEGTRAEGRQVVDRIEFSVGQGGYLHPTVWLKEPVEIEGKIYQKATGNNFEYLMKEGLVPGAECVLSVRIVPRVCGAGNSLSEKDTLRILNIHTCPECGGPLAWDKDSVYRLKCKRYYKRCCWPYVIGRAHSLLKVKGIGPAGVKKLIEEEGFNLLKYLASLKPTRLQLFIILSEGLGEKKAESEYSFEKLKGLIQKYA